MSVQAKDDNTIDLTTNLDIKTGLALAQLMAARNHSCPDDAVAEALLLQAYFMKQARDGYELFVRTPDGEEQRVPLQEMTATLN